MKKVNHQLSLLTLALLLGFAGVAQQRGQGRKMTPEMILERLDADKDGKLSQEETKAMRRGNLADNFAEFDANSDGFLDLEEVKAFMATIKKRKE